jgi:hypothetical protein
MKPIISALAITLLMSCAPDYMTSMCRHKVVECALMAGERYGQEKTLIAIGPSQTSEAWHGQALVIGKGWLVNAENACEFGKIENFRPEIFLTVDGFLKNQFPWVRK